jgi:hypothetical protein
MLRATIVLFVLTLSQSWAADITILQDPNSGLYSWKVIDRGFSLELVQLPPDFIRAVYASRELPPAMIEEVASYCAFGTIARNETKSPVSYRVADWRAVTPDGKRHRLRTKTEWLKHWQKMGVDFSFSILPDAMTFDEGDWAQGFTTIRIPHGTHFDLIYTWRQHGKTFSGKLSNLVCTSDTPKQP